MLNKVKIAIDAMGGQDSPKKIIEGIEISLKSNQENFFSLYGKKDLLEKEISKILVGQHDIIKMISIALLSDGHVILEGIPGVAKTLIAKCFSKALNLDFRRLQMTPDMLPADITGTFIFDTKKQNFTFKEGPIFTNVILADEINRAIPKTQSALLEAIKKSKLKYKINKGDGAFYGPKIDFVFHMHSGFEILINNFFS